MSTTIHVGNLSFSLSEKDLEEYFSKYGKIVDSYIVRRGGRPRGYGFVEFSSTKEADNALAANGEEYSGRVITIELANGKIVKSNFQGNNNNQNNNGGYQNNNGGYQNRGYNNNNGGYRNNNNGGYNNGGYNNGGYRNNNNGGYNNGGYRNNNNVGYNNEGGYRNNNNGGFRNNGGYNNGPRSYQNQQGKTFYTLRQNNYSGPRRNNNNNNNNNGPRRNVRRPETEKEKSVSTVYVSNLPFSYDEKALATMFDGFQVKTAHVVQTRNGRSRGFGFVEFETENDQLNAIKSKDQTEVDGRVITVKVSLVDKNEQSTQNETTEQTTTD